MNVTEMRMQHDLPEGFQKFSLTMGAIMDNIEQMGLTSISILIPLPGVRRED